MGFFQKIKNFLGIGGVKVELSVPGQASKEEGKIGGTVTLTSKSDQEVLTLKVKVFEEFTTGRGDDKKTKEIDLGSVELPGGFTIKAGETKEVPFDVSFEVVKSNAESLKEKGGALGALGGAAKFAKNEKSAYFVEADADVKGVALDPSDKKGIKLV